MGLQNKLRYNILQDCAEKFDILALSETLTNELETNAFPNHTLHFPRNETTTAGRLGGFRGICVLTKTDITNSSIIDLKGLHYFWLKVTCKETLRSMLVCAMYIPHENSRHWHAELFDHLTEDMLLLSNHDLPYIILGDLNSRTGNLPDFLDYEDEHCPSIHGECTDTYTIWSETHIT